MKALILKGDRQFVYTDMPKPVPGEKEVLIQIKAASVCGSDITGIDGSTGRRRPPIIMGHEASGIIEETGNKATRFAKGDRVTFDSTIYCGQCAFCRSGRVNLCDSRRVLGVSCEEYRQHGAFCQYLALPEHIVYKLPDNVTFEQAALTEPVSVALHAVKRMEIDISDTVVIFGTGTIALFSLQLIKLLRPVQIIVIGRNEQKLKLAEELGADVTINSRTEKAAAAVRAITRGQGASKALDAAGAVSTFCQAVESLQKGGIFVTLANLEDAFPLNSSKLITQELTIKGSCAFSGEIPKALDLISRKAILVDYAISNLVPLSQGGAFIKQIYRERPEDFFKCILLPPEPQ